MTARKLVKRLNFIALCLFWITPQAHAAEVYQIGRQKVDLAIPSDYVNIASLAPRYRDFLNATYPPKLDLMVSYAHQSEVPEIMARSPNIPIPRWMLSASIVSSVETPYGKSAISPQMFQAVKLHLMADEGKAPGDAKKEAEQRISNAMNAGFHPHSQERHVNFEIHSKTLIGEFTQTDTQISWAMVEKRKVTGTGFSQLDELLGATSATYKSLIWIDGLVVETEVRAIYYSDADLEWAQTAGAAWTQRILASNR